MKRLLIIIMITLTGPGVRSEYSAYGQPYLDVEALGDGFAVLKAVGKIDIYNSASEQTSTIQTEGVSGAKFMCSVSDALVIAGESSLSCLLDGRWLPMDVPESSRITCLTAFYGGVMAASEDGKLLFWGSPFDKAQIIKTEVSGRFIDMDSFADRCYAVTDRSEIVSIGLGLQPSTFDFNAYYSEYYGEIDIVSVAAGATSVCITGNRGDESPAAFISSNGNVWSERTFDYLESGSQKYMDKKTITAAYREYDDCYVILCEEGVIFHLPACSHCNYPIFSNSGRLTSLAFNGKSFMAVGETIY